MKNLIAIIFLSSLAISATLPTNKTSNPEKVFCQVLTETYYNADGSLGYKYVYNYNGRELISMNCLEHDDRHSMSGVIYTQEDEFNRSFIRLSSEEQVPLKETLNEYGELTYSELLKTKGCQVSLDYEYEEYKIPGTDKMFCRITSSKINVSTAAPDNCEKTIYNYEGDKLISVSRDDVDYPVTYFSENKRKVPFKHGFKIETLNEYGKPTMYESYDYKGNLTSRTVYTYLIQ